MELEDIRLAQNEIISKFTVIKSALKIEENKEELKKLEQMTMEAGFWEESTKSSSVLSKMKQIKDELEKIEMVERKVSDLQGYIELVQELNDIESLKEAEKLVGYLKNYLEKLEIETLLSEEYDKNNAILTIHPGAGGTESQDWAQMLYRMYTRYSQKSDFAIEILDLQDGEEAGIKSVSLLVKGNNAYGYLKGENGVHRLVRISPFDSNSRRHTSFAAVEVMPELDDDIVVDINPEDIEMDVYHASGAGGQHVNKTSSAVRLRHIPTGIVVACQTERSQLQNRENAMKMLKSKIYQLEKENHDKKISNIKGESTDNAWGNQIRSYVFCPYTLVKDHRTGYEVGQVQAVMDGKLDDFIDEYLKYCKR